MPSIPSLLPWGHLKYLLMLGRDAVAGPDVGDAAQRMFRRSLGRSRRRASRAPRGSFDGKSVPGVGEGARGSRAKPPRNGRRRDAVLQMGRRGAPERSTAGDEAEQTSNTARGTPWKWRTCGNIGLRQASMSRGVEVRGSDRTFGVPRSQGFGAGLPAEAREGRKAGNNQSDGLLGVAQDTGDDACLTPVLLALAQQRRPGAVGQRNAAFDPHRAAGDLVEQSAAGAVADPVRQRLAFLAGSPGLKITSIDNRVGEIRVADSTL